jgi:hypothetical protein
VLGIQEVVESLGALLSYREDPAVETFVIRYLPSSFASWEADSFDTDHILGALAGS